MGKTNLRAIWERRVESRSGLKEELNELGVRKCFEKDIIVNWLKEISQKKTKKLKKKLKLLDGGCSSGEYLIFGRHFGFDVIGIDISKQAIKECEKRKLKCILGDVRELPFKDESFDIVTSGGVVEHFPDSEKAISEASRVLKKGGILLIGVPYKYGFFVLNKKAQQLLGLWPLGYEKSFSRKQFTRILEKNQLGVIKIKMKPVGRGRRFPLVSNIIRKLDKAIGIFGLGGHHMLFWCEKK